VEEGKIVGESIIFIEDLNRRVLGNKHNLKHASKKAAC
jgi:hypothetical protein